MLLHFQVKTRELVFVPFHRSNELANSISETELLFFNEHNILCWVIYFRNDKQNKNSVTLPSDMKQNIILFQMLLKSSLVKGEPSQVHLYIHIDMCAQEG